MGRGLRARRQEEGARRRAEERQRCRSEAMRKRRKVAAEEERPSAETQAAVDKFFKQITESHLRPPKYSSTFFSNLY